MSRVGLCWMAVLAISIGKAQTPALQEPWEKGYSDQDAKGPHVLGLWSFDPDRALQDSSGRGNDIKLQGAQLTAEGRFGGGLESFAGVTVLLAG